MPLVDLTGKFALISLETPDAFIFELFPKNIQTTHRANWEPQEVTRGMKPLFYSNGEPARLSVPECWLEGSRTNTPINDDIQKLLALKNEVPRLGRPPALLVSWGDEQLRCVMEEVTIDREFFARGGDPLRARCSLQLVELQEEGTAVDLTVNDDVDSG